MEKTEVGKRQDRYVRQIQKSDKKINTGTTDKTGTIDKYTRWTERDTERDKRQYRYDTTDGQTDK